MNTYEVMFKNGVSELLIADSKAQLRKQLDMSEVKYIELVSRT